MRKEWKLLLSALMAAALQYTSSTAASGQQKTPSFLEQARSADAEAARFGNPGSHAFLRARAPHLEQVLQSILSSGRAAPARAVLPNVNDDPRFTQNLIAMLRSSVSGMRPRIFGGIPSSIASVVELEGSGGRCSGTLITAVVILTAGHCQCENATSKAFFGSDVSNPSNNQFAEVARSLPKTACSKTIGNEYIDPGNDFALVWLKMPSKVTPSVVALPGSVLHVPDVMATGFGYNDTYADKRIIGIKMQADIPVASPNCTGTAQGKPDSDYYGCDAGNELVAAVLDKSAPRKDTCLGDSGGPIFVRSASNSVLLAGVTSRGVHTPGGPQCGDGGIYGLVSDSVISWIAQNGVHVGVFRGPLK